MRFIKQTRSICPECLKVLDATIFEEDNKVYIKKECPEHGRYQDVYWSDYEQYLRAERFRHDGEGLRNPRTKTRLDCPLDCGICPQHKSHTALAIIDVTNRCVTGDTKIILEDGTITEIENLVNNKAEGRILSWDKDRYNATYENILDWQKLDAPKSLTKIRTRTAQGTFTPDHEILVDTSYGPALKRADQIRKGDRIYSISKIPIKPLKMDMIDLLADSEINFFIYLKNKKTVKEALRKKYGSCRKASDELGIRYDRIVNSRISFSAIDLRKLRAEGLVDRLEIQCIKYHRNAVNISVPQLTTDLMYLTGLIDSDGCIVRHESESRTTNYVAFDNQCRQLLEEFKNIYQQVFPSSTIREETNRVLVNSLLLCEIGKELSVATEKSFHRLFVMGEPLIAAYIAGYFDGDGHVSGKSEIAFTSMEKERLERIRYLLKRLGIISNVQRSECGEATYSHNKYFYKCKIVGLQSKLEFVNLVSSRHPEKAKRLRKLRKFLKERGKSSFPDILPKHAINEVKKFLYSNDFVMADLRDPNALYKLARGNRGCSKGYVKAQLGALVNRSSLHDLAILSQNFYLDEVIKVETLENHQEERVYDITVNNTHLFVMSGSFVVSNCNLRCPICFATAGTTGYGYEPSKEEIQGMLQNLRRNDPVPAPALQFSGGEPTVRDDLFELIGMAKEAGFEHVEVNTNGLRLAQSVDYCRGLKEAGMSTVYLQFDGLTSDVYEFARGVDLLDAKMKAIENCRKAGIESIVLVITLVKGVNDHQLGDIIRFAVKNFDVIRCVNVQPVSLCGRIPEQEREKMRITIPDFMRCVEEQTDGKIRVDDFFPVPTVVPISKAVGALKDKRYVEFTAHPHCGMATYVFVEDGEMVPITHYGNVEKFVGSMEKVYEEASKGHNARAKMRLLGGLRHVKFGLLRKYLWPVLKTGSYEALGKLQRKMLMISAMHFMDPYNFDLERVQRCCIHYAVPDGRIIPFCTMNSIHRSATEQKLGIPIKKWRQQHQGKKISEVAVA